MVHRMATIWNLEGHPLTSDLLLEMFVSAVSAS
jgi:hypothetical protein